MAFRRRRSFRSVRRSTGRRYNSRSTRRTTRMRSNRRVRAPGRAIKIGYRL